MKVRMLNDYRVIYRPGHESAMTSENWNGWIYEHIFIAEKYLGRRLRDDEVIHHLDGYRYNNRHENLFVMLNSQHLKLHMWIKSAFGREISEMNPVNSVKPEIKTCEVCDLTLQDKQTNTCSEQCKGLSKRKCTRPSKDELQHLMSVLSVVKIGKMFGVSDNSVRKWAKTYHLMGNTELSSWNADEVQEKVQRLDGEDATNKPSIAPDTQTSEVVGDDIVQGVSKDTQT